jgi:hypothetical protein
MKKRRRIKKKHFFYFKNIANIILFVALIIQTIAHGNAIYFVFDCFTLIIISKIYVYIHRWGKSRKNNHHTTVKIKNENINWFLVLIILIAIKTIVINI